jgi:hypothetical protein
MTGDRRRLRRGDSVPLRKSPMANKVATPLKFGPPSLDTQFAEIRIVSVPADLGGVTLAYTADVVLPAERPASENAWMRYALRLIVSLPYPHQEAVHARMRGGKAHSSNVLLLLTSSSRRSRY